MHKNLYDHTGYDPMMFDRFFVQPLASMPWLSCQASPEPKWKVFRARTVQAARHAALRAAEKALPDNTIAFNAREKHARKEVRQLAAGNDELYLVWEEAADLAERAIQATAPATIGDVRLDASLYSSLFVVPGKLLPFEDFAHIIERWIAWKIGYGVVCDIDGVLYVYGVAA